MQSYIPRHCLQITTTVQWHRMRTLPDLQQHILGIHLRSSLLCITLYTILSSSSLSLQKLFECAAKASMPPEMRDKLLSTLFHILAGGSKQEARKELITNVRGAGTANISIIACHVLRKFIIVYFVFSDVRRSPWHTPSKLPSDRVWASHL